MMVAPDARAANAARCARAKPPSQASCGATAASGSRERVMMRETQRRGPLARCPLPAAPATHVSHPRQTCCAVYSGRSLPCASALPGKILCQVKTLARDSAELCCGSCKRGRGCLAMRGAVEAQRGAAVASSLFFTDAGAVILVLMAARSGCDQLPLSSERHAQIGEWGPLGILTMMT